MQNPRLSTSSIQQHLNSRLFRENIILLETVDSTNTYTKAILPNNPPEGTIVIAEEQTAGRGRLGRNWLTQKGKNLTFSILLKPDIKPEHLGLLSLLAGLAVTKAIRKATSLPAECKWPNDVLLNGKKICGILSEMVTNGTGVPAIIIGIGINVNQSEFPEEIQATASSLCLEGKAEQNRVAILQNVLQEIEHWYIQLVSGKNQKIIEEWKAHSAMVGKTITVNQQGKLIKGRVEDIATDGALVLQCNGERLRVVAGDVTILKNS